MNRFSQLAFYGALRKIDLAPVKSISVTFDPFHKGSLSAREFLFHVFSKRRVKSNPRLLLKSAVANDRQPPKIEIVFNDGHQLMIKSEYLTPAECVESLNVICQQKLEADDTK